MQRNKELNKFWYGLKRLLSAMGDLFVLNLLVILCCVPVLTAGAAWAACYSCIVRIFKEEETGMVFKSFFRYFKQNFKQATLAWLIMLLCLLVFAGDFYYAVYVAVPVNSFFMAFAIIMTVLIMLVALWLFPLIARFENTLGKQIKNASLLAVGVFPRTLVALLICALFYVTPFIGPGLVVYFGWFWLMFCFSLPMYLTIKLFRKQLDAYPDPAEDGEEEPANDGSNYLNE